jgi:transcriptional regulator with GAF, ATPase, and Fis domain
MRSNTKEIIWADGLKEVMEQIDEVAEFNTTVLIRGESGTGKEHVARYIHSMSNRSKKPLLILDCAAIQKDLIESELFGHVKGAFIGAINNKVGLLESANEGTILLDEVGELPYETQPKLLRALEYGDYKAVGSIEPKMTDARIIAATNRDLENMIESGKFRKELFYRLNIVQIYVPPLRERKNDIKKLTEDFVRENLREKISLDENVHIYFPRDRDCPVKANTFYIEQRSMEALLNYSWPGNVREFENAIEHAVIKMLKKYKSNTLSLECLPSEVLKNYNL